MQEIMLRSYVIRPTIEACEGFLRMRDRMVWLGSTHCAAPPQKLRIPDWASTIPSLPKGSPHRCN